jgi:hypothetical protein
MGGLKFDGTWSVWLHNLVVADCVKPDHGRQLQMVKAASGHPVDIVNRCGSNELW